MDKRILLALSVYGFLMLGVFLLVAPWTPVWHYATGGLSATEIGRWIASGWVRGAVSGLGALDLVVGLQAAGELWRRQAGDG